MNTGRRIIATFYAEKDLCHARCVVAFMHEIDRDFRYFALLYFSEIHLPNKYRAWKNFSLVFFAN